MAISATIPVEHMAGVNKALEQMGHGIGNFSVPTSDLPGAEEATHASLHLGGRDDAYLSNLQSLQGTYPGLVIDHDSNTTHNFAAHLAAASMEWVQPVLDGDTEPYMRGDQRTYDGKTWESLIDNNVWKPPINWREVGENPDWVQPSGSTDAYPAGATVTHDGQVWVSDLDNNVWEPGVYGWTAEAPQTDEWAAGVDYSVGQQVVYQGILYECLQAHTSLVGWEPPRVPALWGVV